MSRAQVNQAFAGILLGMLVAILSTSIVATSLPRIITDLTGNQTTLTWVVTGALLAVTVSTPIWGKLADLTDRKALLQIALLFFLAGSIAAGFAQEPTLLIASRVVQGIGTGGLLALAQIAISDILSPRERGKYMGVLGAVVTAGTAGGPLLGGLITDAFGWRWNFFLVVPFAIAAMITIQLTLRLPKRRRKATIDYLGALLLTAGVSLLLIWLSLAGQEFDWGSPLSWSLAVGAVLLLGLTVLVESRAKEPIIPLTLFRNRTFTLSVLASFAVGVSLYSISVFLSQYMQLSRGATPTQSGLLTLPQVIGTLIASTVVGGLISRSGYWKKWMVTGAALVAAGIIALSTLRVDTPFPLIFVYMAAIGLGLGMLLQNLILVVQNSVDVRQIGAASSTVAFFRSLGGTLGVTVLGVILSARVGSEIQGGLVAAGESTDGFTPGGSLPDVQSLTGTVRSVVETAYGAGIGEVFLVASPLAVIALLCVIFMPNNALGTKTGIEQLAEVEKKSPDNTGVTK